MKGIPIDIVLKTLKKEYPDAVCTLDFNTSLDLLVATILAAQCTDARVNIVTKSLFKKYSSPSDYIAVSPEELEQDVHSCGSFRMKAKAIQETCATILRDFSGQVPRNMKDMLTLRGVGRKTAAVVLATAFGIVEGIPVDTHCIRLSRRMGLTREYSQDKIERDLMAKTPQKDWALLSHLLVAHGRKVCHARTPLCRQCKFSAICPSSLLRGRHPSP